MDRTDHHQPNVRTLHTGAPDIPDAQPETARRWQDWYDSCVLLRKRISAVLAGAANSEEAGVDAAIIIDLIWLAEDLCEELRRDLDGWRDACHALEGVAVEE